MSDKRDGGISFESPPGGIWIRDDKDSGDIKIDRFAEGGILLVEEKPKDDPPVDRPS